MSETYAVTSTIARLKHALNSFTAGTMICCYMLHSSAYATADECLSVYGAKRTYDSKGVTIPSQRRYVGYYGNLMGSSIQYMRIPLQVGFKHTHFESLCVITHPLSVQLSKHTPQFTELRMSSAPHLSLHASSVHFSISFVADSQETCLYSAELPDIKRSLNAAGQLVIQLSECLPLAGDVKVELFHKAKMMRKRQVLLRFWVNTFFISELLSTRRHTTVSTQGEREEWLEFTLAKHEIDFAHKDKEHRIFPNDFHVSQYYAYLIMSLILIGLNS